MWAVTSLRGALRRLHGHRLDQLRHIRQNAGRTEIKGRAHPFERMEEPTNGPASLLSLARPTIFTLAFGGTCFCGAAIWQYEDMRSNARSLWKQHRRRIENEMQKLRDSPIFESVFSKNKKNGSWRQELNRMWNNMSDGNCVFATILAINVAVFLAWRVPTLKPVMLRHFASNPSSKHTCLPMLLSTFSHYNLLHLFINMYCLHSFCDPICRILGKEQFVGIYLTSGVISSYFSHVVKVVTARPYFSVGASGAILCLVGIYGTLMPEARLHIAFLPSLSFTAGTAIKCIGAFDAVGMLAGWRIFDHAAHLGGLLFGIWWVAIGNGLIWSRREKVMRWWHDNFRGDDPPPPPPPILM